MSSFVDVIIGFSLLTLLKDTILKSLRLEKTNLEEEDPASLKVEVPSEPQKLPKDALKEAQIPPLCRKRIVVRSLVGLASQLLDHFCVF